MSKPSHLTNSNNDGAYFIDTNFNVRKNLNNDTLIHGT